MIPKIIHYCWFGGNPLPELGEKCIASWKKYLPGYEIKEWNESNFDLNCCDYVKEAYAAKKWAFVSDYARFYILYKYGGLYFDTDVEVIKDMSKIIEKGQFVGCEINDKGSLEVNPGLGLGAISGTAFYKKVLEYYENIHFNESNSNIETVVDHTTRMMKKYGWRGNGTIEKIEEIYVYPSEFFCPYNFRTGKLNITENTLSIHHYSASWISNLGKIVLKIERCDESASFFQRKIRHMLSLPFRGMNTLQKKGIIKSIRHWLKIDK